LRELFYSYYLATMAVTTEVGKVDGKVHQWPRRTAVA
jgi:hypothetical protein